MSSGSPLFRDDYGRAISERAASGSKRLRCVVSNARIRWVELKNVDTLVNGPLMINNTGSVTPLTLVATGSGPTERVARSVKWVEAQMRFQLIAGIPVPTQPYAARVLFVWDRQPSGVLPAALDIFDDLGTGVLQSWSPPRMEKMDRFFILWERMYPLNLQTDQCIHLENLRLELESCVSVFSGSTAAITDVSTGALYMVAFSDENSGSGITDASINGSFRLLFSDC